MNAWHNEHSLLEADVTRYITNPLNAFAIINRATSDIQLISQRFSDVAKEFLNEVKSLQPSDDDLAGAVDGLLRLQVTYKLKTEDFANGIINGKKTRKPLSVHDLFVIGVIASKMSDKENFALEYLNLALNLIDQGHDVDVEVDDTILLSHLVSCYLRTKDYTKALRVLEHLIEMNPNSSEFIEVRQRIENEQKEFGTRNLIKRDPYSDHFIKDGTYSEFKETIFYGQVCRGDVAKSFKEQAELRCRYVSNSPFAKLARFKIEEVNLDPYIVLYIDILTDDEIRFLKEISKQTATRAQIVPGGKNVLISNDRVAQIAWHDDLQHEVLRKISQRVEASC